MRGNPSIDPTVLGKRLSDLRKSRGISQEVAAKRLELSRPTFIAIEKGTRPATPDELLDLAMLYGCSVHDFAKPGVSLPTFAPLCRLTSAPGINQENLSGSIADFQGVCEAFITLLELAGGRRDPPRYPEQYSILGLPPTVAAEEIADLERGRLALGQRPVADLFRLLEKDLGLTVFVMPLREFRIAGMFQYVEPLGGCVLVNGSHPRTRQYWTAAHELGHFLVDRYSSEVTMLPEGGKKPPAEQFADCFAANFLMPSAGLRQGFNSVVRERGDFTVADLCWMADHYLVSVEAMARRLEGLGCLGRGAWLRLSSSQLGSSKVRKELGLAPAHKSHLQLPTRYVNTAARAFELELIGESELMRYLRCSRVEARELIERLGNTSDFDQETGDEYQLTLPLELVLSAAHSREA